MADVHPYQRRIFRHSRKGRYAPGQAAPLTQRDGWLAADCGAAGAWHPLHGVRSKRGSLSRQVVRWIASIDPASCTCKGQERRTQRDQLRAQNAGAAVVQRRQCDQRAPRLQPEVLRKQLRLQRWRHEHHREYDIVIADARDRRASVETVQCSVCAPFLARSAALQT